MYLVATMGGIREDSPRFMADVRKEPDSFWTDDPEKAFRIRSRRLADIKASTSPRPAWVETESETNQ